ncbi:MAG: hypothetical protein VXY73_09180 [Pseudomonadota bacterium]|jgi:hypothetical protein|nr:hypothetical protein [Pseudomonadota bacterium]
MEKKKPSKNSSKKQVSREDRLKQALKANLARRKAQARARDGNEAADKG